MEYVCVDLIHSNRTKFADLGFYIDFFTQNKAPLLADNCTDNATNMKLLDIY